MSGLHLKRLHADADSFLIWLGPDTPNKHGHTQVCTRSLGIHIDFPWSECVQQYDAPKRITLHLYWWHVLIALGSDGKSQVWHHREGNLYRWRRITWHPNRSIQCRKEFTAIKPHCGDLREWECSRLRHHRGSHA